MLYKFHKIFTKSNNLSKNKKFQKITEYYKITKSKGIK